MQDLYSRVNKPNYQAIDAADLRLNIDPKSLISAKACDSADSEMRRVLNLVNSIFTEVSGVMDSYYQGLIEKNSYSDTSRILKRTKNARLLRELPKLIEGKDRVRAALVNSTLSSLPMALWNISSQLEESQESQGSLNEDFSFIQKKVNCFNEQVSLVLNTFQNLLYDNQKLCAQWFMDLYKGGLDNKIALSIGEEKALQIDQWYLNNAFKKVLEYIELNKNPNILEERKIA